MPHPIPGNLDLLEAENKFLKQTLNVLRLEFEKKQSEHEEQSQIAIQLHEQEKKQFQNTIHSLRRSLETIKHDHDAENQRRKRNLPTSKSSQLIIIN